MIRHKLYILFILFMAFAELTLFAQRGAFKLEKIPVITDGSADDYGPVKYKDGLVFISNRKRGAIDNYQYKSDDGSLYDCYNYYFTKIDPKDGTLSQPELFDLALTSRSNKGPLVFSSDEKTMYFTKNLLEPKHLTSNNKENPIGIFIARFDGSHWTDIKPFPNCTGKFNYGHPLLSADEKRMYFVSDTAGGIGGLDIWYSDLRNGQWTSPVNGGSSINSTGDESDPVLFSNGRLYFTFRSSAKSRGQNYFSDFINDKWTPREIAPDILGTNTSVKYLLTDSLLFQGYYVEERNQVMRIRKFTSIRPKFDTIAPIIEPKFCFTFFDKAAPLLDTATMMYEWDFGNGDKVRGAQAYHCFPQGIFANYVVNLNVIDKATGSAYFSEASYNFAIEDFKQVRIKIALSEKGNAVNLETFTGLVNQKIYFSVDNSNLKGLKIEQYFWDFGDPLLKAVGPSASFIFRKAGTYKVKCGVTGKGNIKLSNYIILEVKNGAGS